MKICKVCGAEFEAPPGSRKKYCNSCRVEKERESNRKQQAEYKNPSKLSIAEEVKRREQVMNDIVVKNQEAINAGISYGKYVAMTKQEQG